MIRLSHFLHTFVIAGLLLSVGASAQPSWRDITERLSSPDQETAEGALRDAYDGIRDVTTGRPSGFAEIADATALIRLSRWSFEQNQTRRSERSLAVLTSALKGADGKRPAIDAFTLGRISQMALVQLRNSKELDSRSLAGAIFIYSKTTTHLARATERLQPFLQHENGLVRWVALDSLAQKLGVNSSNFQILTVQALDRSQARDAEFDEMIFKDFSQLYALEDEIAVEDEFVAKALSLLVRESEKLLPILRVRLMLRMHGLSQYSLAGRAVFAALAERRLPEHKDALLNEILGVMLSGYNEFTEQRQWLKPDADKKQKKSLSNSGRDLVDPFDLSFIEFSTLELMRKKPDLDPKVLGSVLLIWEDPAVTFSRQPGIEDYVALLGRLNLAYSLDAQGIPHVRFDAASGNWPRLRKQFSDAGDGILTPMERLFYGKLKVAELLSNCDGMLGGRPAAGD